MSLDLFQTDNRDAINGAERSSAPLLPAGFKESFDTAWDNAVLFGQSFAVVNARHRAMDGLFQQAYDATKDDRFRRDSVQFENRFRMPSAGAKDLRQVYNDIVGEHLAEQPEREVSGFPPTGLRPISPEELDVHAADISKDAREAYKAMAARQGGGFGTVAGTAAGTIIDPINVLTFPLAAPEAAGIIKTGLTWAGIGGGTQAAIEAVGSPFREKVEPGYAQSSEPGMNILESGAFAGTLGATIKALGTGWRWYANKSDVPRTIRDAGNVLDSETQVAETNPLRGPEGETAHRAALSKTLDDVVKGDVPNVDGIITPEMMDGYQSRLTPVMKARQAALEASSQAALLAREDARLPGTMERLSEMQLGEIRGAVDALDTGLATRVTDLTEQVTKARAAVEAQTATVEKLRGGAAATGFKTAKGSTYELHPDGTTTRNKAARSDVGHEGDSGLKSRTERTVYVDDAQVASALSAAGLQGLGPKGARVIIKDGKASLLTWNEAAGQWGRSPQSTDIKISDAPAVGKAPLELWKKADDVPGYEAYRGMHAGNAITEVASAATDDAKLAARLAKAEAKLEALTATAEQRAGALPLRQVTAEARAADRKGRTTSEMTKAITRLAEDGYGLKLDAAEIATLADRILKAPADEVEATLRDTTEHLVDKARAQRALAPPTPFGEARPHEAQAAHALRITNIMRMRVQTLAREVGYAMPKEEAGAIAARLLEVKEPDALAILDELVLRPRTIAKTMAEPRPTVPEGIPTPPTAEDSMAAIAARMNELKQDVAPARPQAVIEDHGNGSFFAKSTADESDLLHLQVGRDGALHAGIATVGEARRGQGVGMALYERAIQLAEEQGRRFVSDNALTADGVHVYEALKRRGYEVIEAPNTTKTKKGMTNMSAGYVYEVKPKPAAPPPASAGFTTGKGSTYELHADGTTTRNKAARTDVGHEGDFGPKPRSEKTVYLDTPALAAELSAAGLQGLPKEGSRVILKDGQAMLLIWNRKANNWGKSSGAIPFSTEPGVGKAPLELWKKTDDMPGYESYANMHAGNAISDVRPASPSAPVPAWLQQNRQEAVDFANRLGVTDQIRQMANEGKTAAEISKALGEKMSVDEVRAVRDSLGIAPAGPQAGIGLGVMPAYERAAAEQHIPANIEKLRTDPEMTQTVERDLQRMRAETPDKEIPVGVDKDGAPITRTVEEAATDVEQRQKLAEEIRASCGPQPETDGEGGGSSAAGLAAGGGGGAGLLALGGGDEAQAADMPARTVFDNMTDEQIAQLPDFHYLNALSSRINQENFQRMLRETPPSVNIEDRRGAVPRPRKDQTRASE